MRRCCDRLRILTVQNKEATQKQMLPEVGRGRPSCSGRCSGLISGSTGLELPLGHHGAEGPGGGLWHIPTSLVPADHLENALGISWKLATHGPALPTRSWQAQLAPEDRAYQTCRPLGVGGGSSSRCGDPGDGSTLPSVVTATRGYTVVKTHQSLYLKWMIFILSKLYLNKVDFSKCMEYSRDKHQR